MPHVVFVAPHFLKNTNRYLAAFAALDGVTLSVISEDPQRLLPPSLQQRLAGHYQVRSVSEGAQLAKAAGALRRALGPIDRLTGALEQLQLPMAEARQQLDLPGMRPEVARRFRDKDLMKAVLREHGVPVAKSALVHSLDELRRFIDRVGFPVIVKPQAGLGSKGTHRLDSEADLAALARLGLSSSASAPLQAEQFVHGKEHTCETVTIHGKPVWRSGTRYFPSPLEVLETPWIQYCVLLPREVEEPFSSFAPINDAALAALFGPSPSVSGTALTHMEWFLGEDESMLVSEVGARPPGVHIMPMMGLTHGTDLIADWAELIAFDRFTPKARVCAAGVAFFRGHGGGTRVARVQGLQHALELVGSALVELQAPEIGQVRAQGYEGEGYALVRHETTEGVREALLALIQNVQVTYA